jgi:biotin transport system substrate-specific component
MAQALWPRRTEGRFDTGTRDAALVIAFSLITALSAQVTIHLPLVPITGQTFGVLLTGALLGPRLGALAMMLYLVEGCCGLPVFAEGHSAWTPGTLPGVPTIVGPSAGYLYSYPFAAGLIGWLAGRGWDRRPVTMLLAMLLSSLLIYAVGFGWLAHLIGPSKAWALGVLPFLPGDGVKALLAAGLLPAGWKLLGRRER